MPFVIVRMLGVGDVVAGRFGARMKRNAVEVVETIGRVDPARRLDILAQVSDHVQAFDGIVDVQIDLVVEAHFEETFQVNDQNVGQLFDRVSFGTATFLFAS